MKHFTLLFSSILLSGAVNAQANLTGTDINAVIGQSSTTYITNYVSPGNAGANQTWDLSALSSSQTAQRNYTSGSSLFPGSNITLNQSSSGNTAALFLKNDNTGQYYMGVSTGPTTISYDNAMTQLDLPLVYNSAAVTDNFHATFSSNGINFVRSGTITQTVDGYGTLITPEGTFSNVLRVKLVQDYSDVSSVISIDYDVTVYAFYKAGFKDELASVNMLATSQGGNSSSGTYLETGNLGLTDAEIGKLEVYPNPFQNVVNIDLSENSVKSIFVTDVNGRTFEAAYTQTGSTITIDSESLSSGVYFIRLDYTSGKIEQAKIVKQ